MKWLRAVWTVSCVLSGSGPTLAGPSFSVPTITAQRQSSVSAQKTKVLDLVYRVEDMGSKAEKLQVRQTGDEVRIDIAADVLFAFDKATILQEAQGTLEQAAKIIRERAKGPVRIEGYTDGKGADTYNLRLSERRAAAVKGWFVNHGGLTDVVFATKGFGARNPVAPNKKPDGSDDPEGRAKNRRVEIILRTRNG